MTNSHLLHDSDAINVADRALLSPISSVFDISSVHI